MPEPSPNRLSQDVPQFSGSPDQRPSADEWRVLWNAAPQEEPEDDEAWEEEPSDAEPVEYTYVNSVPGPLPYGLDHDDAVKEALLREVSRYLQAAGLPVIDEYGGTRFDRNCLYFRGEPGGEFEPLDRTIEISLSSPEIFTPGCVRHIQRTVLRQFPLWRVQIVATIRHGEQSLTIYPDAVRAGERLSPPADFDTLISDWQESIRRIREPVEGPKRRQALYVRRLLPEVLPTVPRDGVALIAVFN
ncbi:MAG: hypothetical protein M3552_19995, partial [Planctomycetota bacterium]|nr:hypothetical protein [Planctomycetota bacterium]